MNHPSYQFGDYTVVNIYNREAPEIRKRCVEFWRNRGMFTEEKRQARAREILQAVMDGEGRVVGLCTVAPYIYEKVSDDTFFFFRMILDEAARIQGMSKNITQTSFPILEALQMEDKPRGMMIVASNEKLMRKGAVKGFEDEGYTSYGFTPKGFQVWVKYFEQPVFSATN